MDVQAVNNYDLGLHPQNSTSLASLPLVEPVMHAFSSLLLLGTFVFQTVVGRPDSTRVRREGEILKRSVDSFVATESPIALSKLLCNIGSSGCAASGAASGVVVASPSKSNPDCKSIRPWSQVVHADLTMPLKTGIRGPATVLWSLRL
jgi:glucoamylase